MSDNNYGIQASIVVATHNRQAKLAKCIDSVSNQTIPPDEYELIVVDDDSSDGTREFCAEQRGRVPYRFTYLTQEAGGPARARNLGISAAAGDLVCFIDDDSVVRKEWLQKLLDHYYAEPQSSAGFKGRVENLSSGPEESFSDLLGRYVYRAEHSYATNNIAYRKTVLKQVEGFNTTFPVAAYEDVDLALRIKRKGYNIVFCNDIVVRHPYENTLDEFKNKCFVNGIGLRHYLRVNLFKHPLVSCVILLNELLPLFKSNPFRPDNLNWKSMGRNDLLWIKARWTITGLLRGKSLIRQKDVLNDEKLQTQ